MGSTLRLFLLAGLLGLHALPATSLPLAKDGKAPLPTPAQIHVTLGADAHHYVVSWITFEDQPSESVVQYGAAPDALTQEARATPALFNNSCGVSRALHDVAIAASELGQTIYYRVSSGGKLWSAVTALAVPRPNEPDFAFSLMGDMGINCGITSVSQLIVDTAAGEHQMVVHYGDIAYNLDDQCGAVGDLFMNAVSPFASQVPVVFGVGNHETAKNYTYIDFLQRFRGQTDIAQASGSSSIRYLSFNVGLTHIAMVDTDAYIYSPVYPIAPPQYAWLEQDLKSVDRSVTPWLILIGHRAMYCDPTGDPECDDESATIRNGLNGSYGLEPLMLKYGVDMYFAGHTHRYQRNWPVARGQAVQKNYTNPRAPVHVQSGIGGVDGGEAFLPESRAYTAFRDTDLNIGYGRIVVHNATHLSFSQRLAVNGTVLDSFTIVQGQHGPFTWLL